MRAILFSLLMNLALTSLFVWLNSWALRSQLEETFIALAVGYGLATTIANVLYPSQLFSKASPKDVSR